MTRHRFLIVLDIPDALYEEEKRVHAPGTAPLPDHPSECSWKDITWLGDVAGATVEITDYTQIGPSQ